MDISKDTKTCCEKCRSHPYYREDTRGLVVCEYVACECHTSKDTKTYCEKCDGSFTTLNHDEVRNCLQPDHPCHISKDTYHVGGGGAEVASDLEWKDTPKEVGEWRIRFEEEWSDAADPTPNRKSRIVRFITLELERARTEEREAIAKAAEQLRETNICTCERRICHCGKFPTAKEGDAYNRALNDVLTSLKAKTPTYEE